MMDLRLDRKQKIIAASVALVYISAFAMTYIELGGEKPLWQQDNVYIESFQQPDSMCITGSETLTADAEKISARQYEIKVSGTVNITGCKNLEAEIVENTRTSYNLTVRSSENADCEVCSTNAKYDAVLKTRVDSVTLNIIHGNKKKKTVDIN